MMVRLIGRSFDSFARSSDGGASFVMVSAPHIFLDAMIWGSRQAFYIPEQV